MTDYTCTLRRAVLRAFGVGRGGRALVGATWAPGRGIAHVHSDDAAYQAPTKREQLTRTHATAVPRKDEVGVPLTKLFTLHIGYSRSSTIHQKANRKSGTIDQLSAKPNGMLVHQKVLDNQPNTAGNQENGKRGSIIEVGLNKTWVFGRTHIHASQVSAPTAAPTAVGALAHVQSILLVAA